MQKETIRKKYRSFIDEIANDLLGKNQGYVKILKIGKRIFPYSIPPQIEIVLLDPEDQTVIYRRASDPDSFSKKKGEWMTGTPFDVVCSAIGWAEEMKGTKSVA